MTNLLANQGFHFSRGRHPARLALATAMLLCLSALSAQNWPHSNRLGIAPGESVQLVYSEGQVTMNGVAIDIGATITDNALIKTGKGAVAEIAFRSKNIIRIGPNATVRLSLSSLARQVDVQKGYVAAVLHRLDKVAGGALDLKTPLASAGVRGTTFCTWVEESGKVYFCSCNGSVELEAAGSDSPFIHESSHHKAIWFTEESKQIKTTEGVLEGHTDKDLEDLAARIGDKMDWTRLEE